MGICWKLGCKEQSVIKRTEFVDGFAALRRVRACAFSRWELTCVFGSADSMAKLKREAANVKRLLADASEFRPFYEARV